MIPGPWISVVLALAAFRLTRLAGWDDFPPVARARAWLTGERVVRSGSANAQMGLTSEESDVRWEWRRPLLAALLACPYCIGFWISLSLYVGWVALDAPGALTVRSPLLYAVYPLGLSAAVGIIARRLDPA